MRSKEALIRSQARPSNSCREYQPLV